MRTALSSLAAVALLLVGGPAHGAPQIVSQLPAATAVTNVGGGVSYNPILTPDGRWAVFASSSDNLVAGLGGLAMPEISPAQMQVFARDRQSGATTLISLNLAGNAGGNGNSFPDAISADGRFVVFESDASNLAPGDNNGARDVFLRDTVNNTTTLISAATNGLAGDGASSDAAITPDGRYIAFVSAADNLLPGDTNGIADIFVRDTSLGTTTLASPGARAAAPTMGFNAINGSRSPVLSADGRYVAFFSAATNLVSGVGSSGEVYLRDLAAGTTAWASGAAHAINASEVAVHFAMSTNGQFIAFQTTGGAPPGLVMRYHTATGTADNIATNSGATSDDADERQLDINADGRYVAFTTTNAPSGSSVKLYDGASGAVSLVSGTNFSADCEFPRLDASGRYVAFLSDDSTLTANSDANDHIYLRDTSNGAIQLVDATPGTASPISLISTPFHFAAGGTALAFDCGDGSLSMSPYKSDAFVRDFSANQTAILSVPAPTMPSFTPLASSGGLGFSLSSNGQYVAFTSSYDPLNPADSNGFANVFVHDFATGSNTLVSVNPSGAAAGSSQSLTPAISADGRWVAFASAAANLIANDTNGAYDIFLRDMQSNTTTLVSADLPGTGEGKTDSTSPQVSADGRYVLFFSTATNLTTTRVYNPTAFWRDMRAGVTYMLPTTNVAAMTPDGSNVLYSVNTDQNGLMLFNAETLTSSLVNVNPYPAFPIAQVAVSPDASRAAFLSRQNATASTKAVFAADLIAGTNWQLATIAATSQGFAQFSSDSRFLAYLAEDTNKINQVHLYDFQAGTDTLVSQAYSGGGGGNGASDSPVMGGNRYVAYRSAATNLVPGDVNGVPDIFLYDRLTGATTLLTASQLGPFSASARSRSPEFSADGQTLVFQSWASDLASGDGNEFPDVFAVALGDAGGGSGTNAAPPAISAMSLGAMSGGQTAGQAPLSLTWGAATGAGYQVQFKNNLSDPQWQTLTNPATVVGGQGQAVDASPDPLHRFYRIVSF